MSKNDFFGMSDEDFLNAAEPEPTTKDEAAPEQGAAETEGGAGEGTAAPSQPETQTNAQNPEQAANANDADAAGDVASGSAGNDDADKDPAGTEKDLTGSENDEAFLAKDAPVVPAGSGDDAEKPAAESEPKAGEPEAGQDGTKAVSEKPDTSKETDASAEKPIDFEAVYKQIMAPFKANGKTIQAQTPEEAIRLMQMGAGFGRKLQDLQPHLKTLRMLEKNDLLDEGKLGFLIDINNKNPEAIKKLIKDSGIDPLEINPEDNVNYVPQNHSVSDAEVAFHSALSELQAQATGKETIAVINQTWDEDSKAFLWDNPQVLHDIQNQREAGIYDQIAAEIERQKTFGIIPQNAPFLKAYAAAGDALVKAGKLTPPSGTEQPTSEAKTVPAPAHEEPAPVKVLATRTDAPKPAVTDNAKARAAAPTPSVAKKAAPLVNPLAMSDEDFEKMSIGKF